MCVRDMQKKNNGIIRIITYLYLCQQQIWSTAMVKMIPDDRNDYQNQSAELFYQNNRNKEQFQPSISFSPNILQSNRSNQSLDLQSYQKYQQAFDGNPQLFNFQSQSSKSGIPKGIPKIPKVSQYSFYFQSEGELQNQSQQHQGSFIDNFQDHYFQDFNNKSFKDKQPDHSQMSFVSDYSQVSSSEHSNKIVSEFPSQLQQNIFVENIRGQRNRMQVLNQSIPRSPVVSANSIPPYSSIIDLQITQNSQPFFYPEFDLDQSDLFLRRLNEVAEEEEE